MMKWPMTLSLVICVIFSSLVTAKETITWITLDWPPYYIASGSESQRELGILNQLLPLWEQHFSNYEHRTSTMSIARGQVEQMQGRNVCNPFLLYSKERETQVVYSKPHGISIPVSLIMRSETAEKLNWSESVSITEVITHTELNSILQTGRYFSDGIDENLNDDSLSTNFQRQPLSSFQLMQMLNSGRIDYLIEYQEATAYMIDHLEQQKSDFVALKIEETPDYILTFMACTNNDWGRKVIEQYNLWVESYVAKESYIGLLLQWQIDTSSADRIVKIYREQLVPAILATP